MPAWTRAVPALLAAATLAVAGCGGDGDEEPAAPAPEATATAGSGATPEGDGTPVPDAEVLACEPVTFTPDSDNGAFEVRASGIDCETARDVAAAAEDQGTGPFTENGFECSGTADEATELPSVDWACVRGRAEVTFSTS